MRKINEAQELRDAIDMLGTFLNDKHPDSEVADAYYHISGMAQETLWMEKHAERLQFERNAYAGAFGMSVGLLLGAIVAYLFTAGLSSLGIFLGCVCLVIALSPEAAIRVMKWRESRRGRVDSLKAEEQA